MAKHRSGPSRKTRFEVFKRDKFICQYCGRKAPDVVLEIDHIEPVSKGGKSHMLNLVTSCWECNGGKGARTLSEHGELAVQRAELERLAERRAQLDAMMQWRKSLAEAKDAELELACERWSDLASGTVVSEEDRRELRGVIRKFGLDEVLTAMEIASETYLRIATGEQLTQERLSFAINKIGGICYWRRASKTDPTALSTCRILAALRRHGGLTGSQQHELLETAKSLLCDGVNVQDIVRVIYGGYSRSYTKENLLSLRPKP